MQVQTYGMHKFNRVLIAYLGATFVAIALSIILESFMPLLFPSALLAGAYVIRFPRIIYFILIAVIPFSMDIYLPGGLGTDLPTEPLMWVLFGMAIIYFLHNINRLNYAFLMHPGTLLLLTTYCWMWVATIFAEHPLFAVKFSLAKTWYVAVCFFVAAAFMSARDFYDRVISALAITISLIAVYVLVRHAMVGFDFAEAQFVVQPFFSNNVYYAALLIAFAPLLWAHWKTRDKNRWKYGVIMLLVGAAIILSYKRVALVAIAATLPWYLIIRFRFVKPALVIGGMITILTLAYFVRSEKFLDYAPRYEQTISYYEFDDLLSATYQGKDISTMERVYRWIAGYYMFRDRPLTGFGPTNFYPVYKAYTITPFKTYVSDNPEKSGMHNYFFMLAVEQGIPGVLLFSIFIVYLLILTQRLYHSVPDPETKIYIMGWGLCIFVVFLTSLMNEVIESDKVGPLFFLSAALLIREGVRRKIR